MGNGEWGMGGVGKGWFWESGGAGLEDDFSLTPALSRREREPVRPPHEPSHATPSPFLGGGEKVAAGRMRGAATHADA